MLRVMPAKNGRNVALTAKQNALVDRLVQSGDYASASEVVRDGLRLLEREEHIRLLEKWLAEGLSAEEQRRLPPGLLARARESLQTKVRQGLDEAERGELIDGVAFFADLKKRLQAKAGRTARKRRTKASS